MVGQLFDSGYNTNDISGNLSIDDSINEYKEMFLKIHGPEILDKLNEKIGEITKFKYEK